MDEYDKKIDEALQKKEDKLLSACGLTVDKPVDDVPPALMESILKQYMIRDGIWSNIGGLTKILIEGYKSMLVAYSAAGGIDAKTANTLLNSCDKCTNAIDNMEVGE
jgi:hypothetical protein